jgi:hypothetical protein
MPNHRISPTSTRLGKPFVIYGLIDPMTLEVKYVGQTADLKQRTGQRAHNAYDVEVREWTESLGFLRPYRVILERGVNRVVRLRKKAVRKTGAPGPSPSGFTEVWLSTCLEAKWAKRFRRSIFNRQSTLIPAVDEALINQQPLPWEEKE